MSSARLRFNARILANAAEASHLARTISIHSTLRLFVFNLWNTARLVWITRVSWWTSARGTMVVDVALSSWSTIAWIAAFFVGTSQIVRAVIVSYTFWAVAFDNWIATVAW